MTGDHILPISFSELTEVELGHFAELAITFIVSHISFLEVLLGKINTLELVQKTNVSESTVS